MMADVDVQCQFSGLIGILVSYSRSVALATASTTETGMALTVRQGTRTVPILSCRLSQVPNAIHSV